jgi:glycosyltransferase involved in cell wall biosynthesis
LFKILIDATGIVNYPTGLGKYSFHIIRSILKTRDFHFTILHQEKLSRDHPFFHLSSRNVVFLTVHTSVIGPERDFHLYRLRNVINRMDLFHCLSSYMPAFGIRIPTVVTIHDLKYLLFPQFFGNRLKTAYYKWVIDRGIHRATQIIAVSEATKADVMKLGVGEEKIRVIYEANTLYQCNNVALPESIGGKPFMLFVGENRPHKNIVRLIEAHGLLMKELGSRCPWLVLAGSKAENSKLHHLGERSVQRIIHVGEVEDNVLLALYKNAVALVYPSLYEGFGLPIVEAMAVGTPVITSRCSSMVEIAGGAAVLVDPQSIAEIADAMMKLYARAGERKRLSRLGLYRARNFSWDKAAALTLNLYEKAILSNENSQKYWIEK